MYCTKCGKKIDYNATVCNECKAAEAGGYYYAYHGENAATFDAPAVSTRMFGFGRALAGVIIGFVGLYVAIFSIALAAILPVAGVVCVLIALSMGAMSLVFGVQSIATFKALKNGPGGSPIATLVVAIHTVVFAALTLLFALLGVFVVAFVLSGMLV